MATYLFKMPKPITVSDGTVIESFSMRETTGHDEEVAANAAKARGGSVTTYEECLRLSLVEVNGEKVAQPYLAFDRWTSKARLFVLAAYRQVNGVEEDSLAGFLAGASEVLPQ